MRRGSHGGGRLGGDVRRVSAMCRGGRGGGRLGGDVGTVSSGAVWGKMDPLDVGMGRDAVDFFLGQVFAVKKCHKRRGGAFGKVDQDIGVVQRAQDANDDKHSNRGRLL
ncbi:hypothetical protein H257_14142 [Aphanomyces astaci]|uniref:Uncharacterized protein n=1 Tax=Aphanomyces astaci TaxID=112090 RepID=W4FSN9_APHAT|nr:hypothetical protein H257_14142 [Aphanomyces astaci]ETV70487.1 hypothetical protein H257_14142 [Aphanomyces astaci]|eukprot:XP_009840199.1 hypothetical protein H257_14142 [Aphanomyces astaci]